MVYIELVVDYKDWGGGEEKVVVIWMRHVMMEEQAEL